MGRSAAGSRPVRRGTSHRVVRCQTFVAEANVVRDARGLVADVLVQQDFSDECCSVAALLTSELVTNAVVHAGSVFEVTVTVDDGRVLVAVVDRSTRLPQPTPVATDATTGRGLELVDAMASAWGAEPTADGKSYGSSLSPRADTWIAARSGERRRRYPSPPPLPPHR